MDWGKRQDTEAIRHGRELTYVLQDHLGSTGTADGQWWKRDR